MFGGGGGGEEREDDEEGSELCPICLGEYSEGETLRVMRCSGSHHFHIAYVLPGLLQFCFTCITHTHADTRRHDSPSTLSLVLSLPWPVSWYLTDPTHQHTNIHPSYHKTTTKQVHRPVAPAQLRLSLLPRERAPGLTTSNGADAPSPTTTTSRAKRRRRRWGRW